MDSSIIPVIFNKDSTDTDIEYLHSEGLTLIENNEFFKDLSNIMEKQEIVEFIDKYFKELEESKAVLLYMKLYSSFKKKYKSIKNQDLSKYLAIYILHYAMSDSELRSQIIKSAYEKIFKHDSKLLQISNNQVTNDARSDKTIQICNDDSHNTREILEQLEQLKTQLNEKDKEIFLLKKKLNEKMN